METFNDEFAPYVKHLDGTPCEFVQDNQSRSKKGVLRGLHFQTANPQGKLVRVIEGEVYDVAIPDLTPQLEKMLGIDVVSYDLTVHLVCDSCRIGGKAQ